MYSINLYMSKFWTEGSASNCALEEVLKKTKLPPAADGVAVQNQHERYSWSGCVNQARAEAKLQVHSVCKTRVRNCSTLDDGLTLRVRASFSEEERVPCVRKRQKHFRRPVLAPALSSPAEPLHSKRAHRQGVWMRDEPLILDATGLFHWCRQRTFQEALLVCRSLRYFLLCVGLFDICRVSTTGQADGDKEPLPRPCHPVSARRPALTADRPRALHHAASEREHWLGRAEGETWIDSLVA